MGGGTGGGMSLGFWLFGAGGLLGEGFRLPGLGIGDGNGISRAARLPSGAASDAGGGEGLAGGATEARGGGPSG
jgi:hypothetical protein